MKTQDHGHPFARRNSATRCTLPTIHKRPPSQQDPAVGSDSYGGGGEGNFARYFAGSRSSFDSHAPQQRKTTRPETTIRFGVPIDPNAMPVTGQSFCRSARMRSSSPSPRIGSAGAASPRRTARGAAGGGAIAPGGAEVAGGEARVQPGLGVEQERAGGRDPLARLEAAHDRVEVAASRSQDDLDPVEHPGHAFDEDDLPRAGVNDRRLRHGQHLARGRIGDHARLRAPSRRTRGTTRPPDRP